MFALFVPLKKLNFILRTLSHLNAIQVFIVTFLQRVQNTSYKKETVF